MAANIVEGVVMWKKQEWVSSIWKLNGSQHEGLLLCSPIITPPLPPNPLLFFFFLLDCTLHKPTCLSNSSERRWGRNGKHRYCRVASGIIIRYSRFIPARQTKTNGGGAEPARVPEQWRWLPPPIASSCRANVDLRRAAKCPSSPVAASRSLV